MALDIILTEAKQLIVKQKKELAELIGFETRNKYAIETPSGELVAFAAEQQKGIWGFLFRQAMGHWRTFTIRIFDPERRPALEVNHPFRFIFQRLDVADSSGAKVGAIQQRFSILYKKFDIYDGNEMLRFTVASPIWKIWTFPFVRNGRQVAVIKKRWAGLLKEALIDADNFSLDFESPELDLIDKKLLLAASIFIDLQYFERKGSGGGVSLFGGD